jgi:hypothetical protein
MQIDLPKQEQIGFFYCLGLVSLISPNFINQLFYIEIYKPETGEDKK